MNILLNVFSDVSLENIIFYLFGFICHQDKSILLGIGENFIPLCPRCLGLHSGFFLTLIIIKLFYRALIDIARSRNVLLMIFSITLVGIHWLLGFFGVLEMDFTSRLVTGMISGSGFCLLLNSLKFKYVQKEFNVAIKYKILLAFFLALLLCIILLGDYQLLILIIFLLVTNNIISIINSICLIVSQNKNYHHLLEIKKELQL